MKILVKAVFEWSGTEYVRLYEESFDYNGPVALMCGATASQNAIEGQQQNFYTQMTQQAGQVFGADSSVFNSLMASFAPTVAAGPSQQGFSPTELSNLNSEAITQTGQSYKNAKEALGEAQSASGGGNTALPSGTTTGENLQLAEGAANQTASELGGITQANYATGRQNYDNAVAGEAGATQAFNSATGFSNATTGSGTAAANTANQIASQNNSWTQLVGGALGGVGGALTGGLMNMIPGAQTAAPYAGQGAGPMASQTDIPVTGTIE